MRTDADPTYARIYATVDSIPKGSVATYGQIAEEAGLPRRARLVGRALRVLPKGSRVPWQRVVAASGRIPDRGTGSVERHAQKLAREGVEVAPNGRIDLKRYRWCTGDADETGDTDAAVKATRSRSRSRR